MKKVLFLSLFTLLSCTTTRQLESEKIRASKIIEHHHDSILPGAVITREVPYLVEVPGAPGTIEKHYYRYTDTTGNAELRFYYDEKLQKWFAECEAKDRRISWSDKQVYEYSQDVIRELHKKKTIPWWVFALGGYMLLKDVILPLFKLLNIPLPWQKK